MHPSTSTPRLIRVPLRHVPCPGSRVDPGTTVPSPTSQVAPGTKFSPSHFAPKQYKTKQTQVTPNKLEGFMQLKMTQTEAEEKTETATVGVQTSSEKKEVLVVTAHDHFKKKVEEVYMRIGKAFATLKPEEFPKIQTSKILANSGEEIVSHISTVVKTIKEILGDDAVYTMFHAVNNATASFSGFHRTTVTRYCKNLPIPAKRRRMKDMSKKERSRKMASRITLCERSKIVKQVHQYWERKEKVTAEAIWKWAKSAIQYRYGLSYFRILLDGIGFCFKKHDRMSVIQERPNVISARMQYLTRKKYLDDENAFFAAFDETWAHDGMGASTGWQHKNGTMYKKMAMADVGAPVVGPEKPKEKGKRGIVLAVLTELGTLPGSVEFRVSGKKVDDQLEDYHKEMNSSACEEYMHKVIPLLAAAAAPTGRKPVLIMDNAPYHNRTRVKPPVSDSSKGDIKKWLTEHNIAFPSKALRPALLKIAQNFVRNNGGREAFTVYELDAWAEEMWGVEILRLPPYHCYWNPIEFLWSQTKENIRSMGNRDDKVSIVENRTLQFLRDFKAEDAKALFEKTRRDENDVREMMLEKAKIIEDTDFTLLYETDEHGRLVNIHIDDSEFEDDFSQEDISAEVCEEHECSDIDDLFDDVIDDVFD
ncbi:hypothetical protein CRE_16537 [Caenorhabditis remanei]|uniref:Tc1-like transposase DDE domain-containing protein n=1 Tax=Caenorhabditis remanei TaxID=31234 RepID=E3NQM8_CAERE|nr:hypothetical protein CRE_16537 [Caenorhabditis remanei]